MSKLEFSITLSATPEKLIDLATDYEKFVNYLPDQIKSIKIVETHDEETITEEILSFSSFMKTEIMQRAIHKKNKSNELHTKVITGPFKSSTVQVKFEKIDSGTKVIVNADLKIPMKYKIATLVIKKSYKIFLTAILYKMNTHALKSSQIT